MSTGFYKFLLIAGIVLISLAGVRSADAATASGPFVDLGALSLGDSDTLSINGGFGNAVISQISGSLPDNSMVTFTYSFDGLLTAGTLGSGGSYTYTSGGNYYEGFAAALHTLGSPATSAEGGSVAGVPSTALAFATAQIDSPMSATAIIKNFSAGAVDFMNLFVGIVQGSTNFEVSYVVSGVPVPAALPLFGLGFGALAYGSRRKKKNA